LSERIFTEKLAANQRKWTQISATGSGTVDDGEPIVTDLRSFAATKNSRWKNQADVTGTSALLHLDIHRETFNRDRGKPCQCSDQPDGTSVKTLPTLMGMVNQDREFGVFILLRLRQLLFVYWASSYNINSFDQLMMANLLASSFNGLLAEKVKLHFTGRPLNKGGGWKKVLVTLVPT